MIPIDLSGKVALVTGVGDNQSFAWYIAKALQAAGAKLVFASHPRMVGIVENILERDADAESRILPYGAGTLKVDRVVACDVRFDSFDDVDRTSRKWKFIFVQSSKKIDLLIRRNAEASGEPEGQDLLGLAAVERGAFGLASVAAQLA